jgi:hypothetical protein
MGARWGAGCPQRAVWVCIQAARGPTPPPDMPDRQGVCCGMACSTDHVCFAIMVILSFSRQQDNTFASITRPHRRDLRLGAVFL